MSGEEAPRGNEWEVVNLTASAYAASSAPTKPIELNHDCMENETRASTPMFTSAHFVFPPNQHENLNAGESGIPQLDRGEEGAKSDMIKDDNDVSFNGDDLMFDGKGSEGFQEDAVFDQEESVSCPTEFQSSRFEESEEMLDHPWWKRMVVSLYSQAKEVDSFWCVLISAAAVTGVVIIGHHGHNKRLQVMQIK